MNNKITFNNVVQRFNEYKLSFDVIELQNGFRIIISQRGGHIFGPFAGDDESILWLNKAFGNRMAFEKFLESGDWNLGGDRIWIAPEIQYNVRDRNDFFGSYDLPRQVDPGNYLLKKCASDTIRLSQAMKLKVHGKKAPDKDLKMERMVLRAENPLKGINLWEQLKDRVIYSGFKHVITLEESNPDDVLSEVWNLTQVNPGGRLFISSLPGMEYSDYYEPVDREYQTLHDNYLELKITGARRFKVGYKSAYVLGRIGYYNTYKNGKVYLLIRSFFSNPSAPYTKEPPHLKGCSGHSLHIYHDNGEYGGFAEVECSGQPIGGMTGRCRSTDQMMTWIYMGDEEVIKKIGFHMLGAKL